MAKFAIIYHEINDYGAHSTQVEFTTTLEAARIEAYAAPAATCHGAAIIIAEVVEEWTEDSPMPRPEGLFE